VLWQHVEVAFGGVITVFINSHLFHFFLKTSFYTEEIKAYMLQT